MSRSLNKCQLIGNLTRDPELRYTPQGTAVCTFSVATNRQWKTESGDTRDEAEFHRVVAWDKLAEICSNLLSKGKKVFVEGRIQTRKWQTQDGQPRTTTEIVISDMLLLTPQGGSNDSYNDSQMPDEDFDIPDDFGTQTNQNAKKSFKEKKPAKKQVKEKNTQEPDDDIPF
jgi:single-strand DNA-binding protein